MFFESGLPTLTPFLPLQPSQILTLTTPTRTPILQAFTSFTQTLIFAHTPIHPFQHAQHTNTRNRNKEEEAKEEEQEEEEKEEEEEEKRKQEERDKKMKIAWRYTQHKTQKTRKQTYKGIAVSIDKTKNNTNTQNTFIRIQGRREWDTIINEIQAWIAKYKER